MEYSEIVSSCYCGDGPEKLKKALALASEYGEKLLQDPGIISRIEGLRVEVASLDRHMAEMEMGKRCSRCAAAADGGCCSAYMGHENNDALQLLMNLLAGTQVSIMEDNGEGCCFLGERGCVLIFKPIFCLNYLCERIEKESSCEDLQILEQKTGSLLGAQVEFERQLITFLQGEIPG